MMVEPRDFNGTEIKRGDVIAYPVRQGSSMWMTKAKVLDINIDVAPYKRTEFFVRKSDTGKYTKFYSPNRAIVISSTRTIPVIEIAVPTVSLKTRLWWKIKDFFMPREEFRHGRQ